MLSQLSLSPTLRMVMQPNEEYIKKLELFQGLFENIKNIKEGDKLGKDNNKYYINGKGAFQRWSRWWYEQDRTKTFTNLDADFSDFFNFCDMLKTDHLESFPNCNRKVATDTITLVKEMIPGLYNLKTAYAACENETDGNKLCIKIDSIILTLIDFKTEMNRPLHRTATTTTTPFMGFRTRTLSS